MDRRHPLFGAGRGTIQIAMEIHVAALAEDYVLLDRDGRLTRLCLRGVRAELGEGRHDSRAAEEIPSRHSRHSTLPPPTPPRKSARRAPASPPPRWNSRRGLPAPSEVEGPERHTKSASGYLGRRSVDASREGAS